MANQKFLVELHRIKSKSTLTTPQSFPFPEMHVCFKERIVLKMSRLLSIRRGSITSFDQGLENDTILQLPFWIQWHMFYMCP